jgi:hypothetical protein
MVHVRSRDNGSLPAFHRRMYEEIPGSIVTD